MEADADALTGIAVNNLCFDHHMLSADWNSQRQNLADRNLSLRAHVKPAQADVSGAGDAGRIATIEVRVHNQASPIMLPPLVARSLVGFIFSNHFSLLVG